ncbi:MAG: TonB-dependent receptor plug domain-containing protein [Paludibacter sp.]|nr:TonB-dependent receptor plug domain-containing protein [Paludibacter sp.]
MTNRILYTLILLFSSVLGMHAQEMNNDATGSIQRQDTLGEVIVKASKDNSTMKEIPASVSMITGKAILENGTKSLNEITSIVPNFFMPEYGSKLTSPVFIRGIGSRVNSPSVGLYVDHVPYFEKAAFDFDFFDLERIEVLRGPQGTEYGRNTMGGIINVVTKSPMDYQGAHVTLLAGNYGTYGINGGYYGKVNDSFGYSLAVNYQHNDGFFVNHYLNNKVDALNSVGLRNRLIWKPTKKITIENIAAYEKSDQGGYPYAQYNDTTKTTKEVSYNQASTYNRILFSDALVLNYKPTYFDFTSTTSYQYLDGNQNIDQDFTKDSVYFVAQRQKQNMLSQELILRSKGKANYNWLFGAFGFIQQFNENTDVDTYKTKTTAFKGYDHRIMGYAFFHQSTISNFIIKNLTLSGGIRLDSENDLLAYQYDKKALGKMTNLADTIYPALKSLEILPKVSLGYKYKMSNFYALVSRGYKTGGFNATFERPEDLNFKPESSWNYEAGVKTALFKNRVYADLTIFYIDWTNQQINQSVPSGKGTMLKNAGHSLSKGMETTIRTDFIKDIDLLVSYGYTNATFVSYTDVYNTKINYNGKYIPFIPMHTIAIQAGKTFEIKHSVVLDKIKLNALYRGTGSIFWDESNIHKQDFFGVVDGRISFIRKSLQLDIWGKNLTNTQYQTFYFESLGKKFVQLNKPMQIGVNLTLNL